MQRIRYGLTGLAFVFLMVLLGTAIIRGGDSPGNAADANLAAQPSDPLAELGVGPGASEDNQAVNSAAPPAQPRPQP